MPIYARLDTRARYRYTHNIKMSEQQNNQFDNMDSTLSLAALSAMSIDDKTSGQTDMAHVNAKTNNSPANSHLSSGSALANTAINNNVGPIIEGSLTKLQQQHNDDGQQQQQYQQQFEQQAQHLQNLPQQFDQQQQQFQQHSQQFVEQNQQPQYEPLTLPIITPEDLPPDMLEAFNSLEPNQQVQALEMLAQQQLLGTYSFVLLISFVFIGLREG